MLGRLCFMNVCEWVTSPASGNFLFSDVLASGQVFPPILSGKLRVECDALDMKSSEQFGV